MIPEKAKTTNSPMVTISTENLSVAKRIMVTINKLITRAISIENFLDMLDLTRRESFQILFINI